MPKGPRTLVDGLAEETLGEMAASFFGARREVENLVERAGTLAVELREAARMVLGLGAVFQGLLPEPAAVAEAYGLLGVDSRPFLAHVQAMEPQEAFRRSVGGWAWTRRGAYAGRVLTAYGAFRAALEAYAHGEYRDDPQHKGRKLLTPNLDGLKALVAAANERIAAVNERPAQVLRMAHAMDVMEVERERHLGGTLDDLAPSIDRDMAYAPLALADLDLPDLPDLPDPAAARKALRPMLHRVYAAHGRLLDELAARTP